jgi:DNA polymerase I-like protein with 3'-5' exonuclease and polymerase domains
MDALVSLICYKRQQLEIDELDKKCPTTTGWSIRRALEEVSFPAINAFADIEINGMYYDWGKLEENSNIFNKEITAQKEKIYKILNIPENINIDSGDQLGGFLKNIGWENPGLSKKGSFLTNEASKQYWIKKGHNEVNELLVYDELHSCMKTYIGKKEDNTGYWQYKKADNRIHPNFMVMMADSWRGKCRNPNLQNVIKRSSIKLNEEYLHVMIRSCFNAPPGYYISENDASGLQLRIATSMAFDPIMVDIFTQRGGDMHSITARSVFCPNITLEEFLEKKKEKPFSTWRKKAKAINFGLLFGATSRVFATNSLVPEWSFAEAESYVSDHQLEKLRIRLYKKLILSYDETKNGEYDVFLEDQKTFSYYWASAEDIRSKFFKTYEGLLSWHKNQIEFGKKNGYVISPWGPLRRVPFLTYIGKHDDGARIKNNENISLNSPVQNFEACYMMYNIARANNELYNRKMKSYIVGNVHDSAIIYIEKSELMEVREILLKYFHEPLPELMKNIPYIIELGYSDPEKKEYWGITENEF